MSEQLYKPKHCAFHPKEMIFNFCKNPECLLPLCPSCVKIHTEQHKSEQTYGQFQKQIGSKLSIHKVVDDLNGFFEKYVKDLNNHVQDMKEHQNIKVKEQEQLKKRIGEAKSKMITVVERFFSDFEKEVTKSVVCFNESIKQNYTKIQEHIENLKKEIQEKTFCLGTDRVLRTLIGFHAKGEQKIYQEQLESMKEEIDYLQSQKVQVVCHPSSIQKVIQELGNYIYLSFQNWQNEIKYVSEFVKTGQQMSTSDGFFQKKTV